MAMTRKGFIKRLGLGLGLLVSAPLLLVGIKSKVFPYTDPGWFIPLGNLSPLDFVDKRDIRKRVRLEYREQELFDFLSVKSGKSDVQFTWYEEDFLFTL